MAGPLVPLATVDETTINMVGSQEEIVNAPVPEPAVPEPAQEVPRSLANPPSRELNSGLDDLPNADSLDDLPEDPSLTLKNSYNGTRDTDPARNSKVMETAKQTDEDPAYVDQNLEQIEKARAKVPESKLEEIYQGTPKTAKWLENRTNMAVTHDDLDALPEVEKLLQSRYFGQEYGSGDPAEAYLPKRYPDLEIGINNALLMGLRIPAGLAASQLALANVKIEENRRREGLPKDSFLGQGVEVPKYLYDNFLTRQLEEENKNLFKLTPNSKLSPFELGKNLEVGQLADTLLSQVIQNAPTQVGLIASAMFGVPSAGLLTMGLGSVGTSYAENKAAGVDEAAAGVSATAKGFIEAAFENLGTLGLFKSTMNSIAKKYGEQSMKQVAKDFVKTLGVHFFGEGLVEEGLTSVTQDLVDYVTGVNPDAIKGMVGRYVDSALVGGFSGVGMTAPAATVTGIQRAQQAQQVQQDLKLYQDVGKAAERLKITDINRPAMGNLLEHTTEDSDVKDVFFDPNAVDRLFQKEVKQTPSEEDGGYQIKATNPVEFAAEMGILPEYEEAKKNGTHIKMTYAKFLEKLVKTNYYSALEHDIKFDAKKSSYNELQEDTERTKKLEAEAAKAETPEQKAAAQAEVDLNTWRKERVSQWMAAGRGMTEARFLSQVELERAKVRSGSDVSRRSPLDLVKALNAPVAVDEVPGQALEQTLEPWAEYPAKDIQPEQFFNKANLVKSGQYEAYKVGNFFWQKNEDGSVTRVARDRNGSFARSNDTFQLSELPTWLAQNDRIGSVAKALGVEVPNRFLKQQTPEPKTGDQILPSPIGYYSEVERQVTGMKWKSDRLTATEVAGKIGKLKGIKKEELDSLGLMEWLKIKESVKENGPITSFEVHDQGEDLAVGSYNTRERAQEFADKLNSEASGGKFEVRESVDPNDGKVTKDELLEFIRDNGIKPTVTVQSKDYQDPSLQEPKKSPLGQWISENKGNPAIKPKPEEARLTLPSEIDWGGEQYEEPSQDWIDSEIEHYSEYYFEDDDRVKEDTKEFDIENEGEFDVERFVALDADGEWVSAPFKTKAELRKWLTDHSVSYSEISEETVKDQKARKAALKDFLDEKASDFGNQYWRDSDNRGGRNVVTDDSTGAELSQDADDIGNGWQLYHSELPNGTVELARELSEAKVQAVNHLIAAGVVAGDVALLVDPGDIEFTHNVNEGDFWRAEDDQLFQNYFAGTKQRYEAIAETYVPKTGYDYAPVLDAQGNPVLKANGEPKEEFKDDVPKSAEKLQAEVTKEAQELAHIDYQAQLNNPQFSENEIEFRLTHEFLRAKLWGNNVNGWLLTFKKDGVETTAEVKAKTVEQAHAGALDILKKAGLTSDTDIISQQGVPRGYQLHYTKTDGEFTSPEGDSIGQDEWVITDKDGKVVSYATERDTALEHMGSGGKAAAPELPPGLKLVQVGPEGGLPELPSVPAGHFAVVEDKPAGEPYYVIQHGPTKEHALRKVEPTPPKTEGAYAPVRRGSWESHVLDIPGNPHSKLMELVINIPGVKYVSNHFPQVKDYLLHEMLSFRKDINGKSYLNSEEFQSDLQQDARKYGSKGTALDEEDNELQQEQFNERKLRAEIEQQAGDLLPDGFEIGPNKAYAAQQYFKDNISEDLTATLDAIPELKALKEKYLDSELKSDRLAARASDMELADRIPNAPFEKTEAWLKLAIKQQVWAAVKFGQSGISWFPSLIHLARWSTAHVGWEKLNDSGFELVYKPTAEESISQSLVKRVTGKFFNSKEEAQHFLSAELGTRAFEATKLFEVAPSNRSGYLVKINRSLGPKDFFNLDPNLSKEEAAAKEATLSDELRQKTKEEGKFLKTKRDVINFIVDNFDDSFTSRANTYKIADFVWNDMQKKEWGDIKPTQLQQYMGGEPPAKQSGAHINRKGGYETLYDHMVPKMVKEVFKDIGFPNVEIKPVKWDDNKFHNANGVEFTPEMVDRIKKGFPLFQQETTITRGFYDRLTKTIGLLKSANWSTALHELSHSWFQEMQEDIAALKALDPATLTPQQLQLIKDGDTFVNFVEAKSLTEVTDEQQEKFARAAEAFFAEGKSPSNELRTVFSRFKKWLTTLGRTATDMGIELSPEVREAFGRLIATEAQMAQARVEMNQADSVGTYGAKGAKAEAILKAVADARATADENFEDEVIADIKRKQSATYREQRNKIELEVTDEVNQEQVYKVIAYLQKGLNSDGSAIADGVQKVKLSKKILNKMFKTQQLEKLPRGISHKDGVHPDIVASMFGFRNATEMVLQMVAAESKADLIARLTDERMRARFPGLLDTPEMSEKAIESLHNDHKAKYLRLQLEALAEHNLPELMKAGQMLIRRVSSDAAVKEDARNTIGAKKMDDIRPAIYQRGEAKAAREAADAYAKGDILKAFERKRNEIYNHQLYIEAQRVTKFEKKAELLFKKVAAADKKLSKSHNMDYVNAARAILSTYGIGDEEATPESYLQTMQDNNPDTYKNINALVQYVTINAKDLTQLTFDEYQGLYESVNSIMELARDDKKVQTSDEKAEMEVVSEEIATTLSEYSKTAAGRMNRSPTESDKRNLRFLSSGSSLRRVESWADQFGDNNPLTKYLVRPIIDAATQYRLKKAYVDKRINEILTPFKGEMVKRPIIAPELNGFEFASLGNLMGALLHSGNESNLFKMTRGEVSSQFPDGWAALDEEGNLDLSRWQAFLNRMYAEKVIEKRHMDAVQQIWNLFEELKPLAQAAHKAMYGYHFSEITAKEITTPFGTYKGGYMPATGDPMRSLDTAKRQVRGGDEFENMGSSLPFLNNGFMKERLKTYATPLIMDLSLVGQAMDKQLKFSLIGPAYKQGYTLINNPQVFAALNAYDPSIVQAMLIPWLDRSAAQSVEAGRAKDPSEQFWNSVWSAARTRTGMQLLPGNFANILEQGAGIVVAASKVHPKYLTAAFNQWRKSPKAYGEWVLSKSDWMKTKTGDDMYEAAKRTRKILEKTGPITDAADFIKEHAYVLQAMMQHPVDNMTWGGAYNEAIANGRTEKQAVAKADSSVRLTQGTRNPEDVSKFETGTPFTLMFKQFAGYFNMILNLNINAYSQIQNDYGFASRRGAQKAFMMFAALIWIPAMISMALKQMFAGDFGEDIDGDGENLDDILWAFGFTAPRDYTLAMVPVVGPALRLALVNIWNDKLYDDKLPGAPGLAAVESVKSIAGVAKAIEEGEAPPKTVIRDFATLMGLITGLPLRPLANPFIYQSDLDSGVAQPTGTIDRVRGYATGKPGKQ